MWAKQSKGLTFSISKALIWRAHDVHICTLLFHPVPNFKYVPTEVPYSKQVPNEVPNKVPNEVPNEVPNKVPNSQLDLVIFRVICIIIIIFSSSSNILYLPSITISFLFKSVPSFLNTPEVTYATILTSELQLSQKVC